MRKGIKGWVETAGVSLIDKPNIRHNGNVGRLVKKLELVYV